LPLYLVSIGVRGWLSEARVGVRSAIELGIGMCAFVRHTRVGVSQVTVTTSPTRGDVVCVCEHHGWRVVLRVHVTECIHTKVCAVHQTRKGEKITAGK
jgi:hypothetical protein